VNRTAIALLTALFLLASACSGAAQPPGGASPAGASPAGGGASASSTASGGGGSKPDPCTLLSPDDLKAQIGVAFQPDYPVPPDECDWAKVGGFTATITLTIKDIGSDGWGCILGAESVAGIGDAACFDGGNGLLHVRHGSWDLVFLRTESVTKDQIVNVAKVAASHL
jgi:hypothetical protein